MQADQKLRGCAEDDTRRTLFQPAQLYLTSVERTLDPFFFPGKEFNELDLAFDVGVLDWNFVL